MITYLDMLMELLQKNEECEWNVKQKVKWPIVQLYTRNLKHKFSIWLKEEKKLIKDEFKQRPVLEVGVCICEPE